MKKNREQGSGIRDQGIGSEGQGRLVRQYILFAIPPRLRSSQVEGSRRTLGAGVQTLDAGLSCGVAAID
jgi:hypothetical protein